MVFWRGLFVELSWNFRYGRWTWLSFLCLRGETKTSFSFCAVLYSSSLHTNACFMKRHSGGHDTMEKW